MYPVFDKGQLLTIRLEYHMESSRINPSCRQTYMTFSHIDIYSLVALTFKEIKMSTLVKTVAISTAIFVSALTLSTYSHGNSDSDSDSMMGNGKDKYSQQMMNMQQHMSENQALMAQIRAEKNVKKREQLMQQHVDAMSSQMETMNNFMGGGHKGKMSPENMPERIEEMGIRMDMMQMMMGQMLDHQDQDQHD